MLYAIVLAVIIQRGTVIQLISVTPTTPTQCARVSQDAELVMLLKTLPKIPDVDLHSIETQCWTPMETDLMLAAHPGAVISAQYDNTSVWSYIE